MALQTVMDLWSVTSTALGATAASASKAAGIAGLQHVAARAFISLAAGATVQPVVVCALRDGATGAGTVKINWSMSNAAQVCTLVDTGPATGVEGGLGIVGSAATAMTLEFTSAPAAATSNSVTLIGYDLNAVPIEVPANVQ